MATTIAAAAVAPAVGAGIPPPTDGNAAGGESEPSLPAPLALCRANLADPDDGCRHLLVVTEGTGSGTSRMLWELGLGGAGGSHGEKRPRPATVLLASHFPRDLRSELHLLAQINAVKRAMVRGDVVVLVHQTALFPSLFDVLNQRGVVKRDVETQKTTRMLRLAVGNRSQWVPVGKGFKIVVLAEAEQAYTMDVPLLNRFEKQVVRVVDALTPDMAQACAELAAFVDGLAERTGMPEPLFGLREQTIPSLVLARLRYDTVATPPAGAVAAMRAELELLASPLARIRAPDAFSTATETSLAAALGPTNKTTLRRVRLVITRSPVQALEPALARIDATAHPLICLPALTSEASLLQQLHQAEAAATATATAAGPHAHAVVIIQTDPHLTSEPLIQQALFTATRELPPSLPVVLVVHIPPATRTTTRCFTVDYAPDTTVVFVDDLARNGADAMGLAQQSPLAWADAHDRLRMVALAKAPMIVGLAPQPFVDVAEALPSSSSSSSLGDAATTPEAVATTPKERALLWSRLVQTDAEWWSELRRLARADLAKLPASLVVDMVSSQECSRGTLADSLELAFETCVVRSLAHALFALDVDFNARLAVSQLQPVRDLWFALVRSRAVVDTDARVSSRAAGVGRSAAAGAGAHANAASTPASTRFLPNSGAAASAVIASCPFSARLREILTSAARQARSQLLTAGAGAGTSTSTTLTDLATTLKGVLAATFKDSPNVLALLETPHVARTYVLDACASASRRRKGVPLAEQAEMALAVARAESTEALSTVAHAHAALEVCAPPLFSMLAIRAALARLSPATNASVSHDVYAWARSVEPGSSTKTCSVSFVEHVVARNLMSAAALSPRVWNSTVARVAPFCEALLASTDAFPDSLARVLAHAAYAEEFDLAPAAVELALGARFLASEDGPFDDLSVLSVDPPVGWTGSTRDATEARRLSLFRLRALRSVVGKRLSCSSAAAARMLPRLAQYAARGGDPASIALRRQALLLACKAASPAEREELFAAPGGMNAPLLALLVGLAEDLKHFGVEVPATSMVHAHVRRRLELAEAAKVLSATANPALAGSGAAPTLTTATNAAHGAEESSLVLCHAYASVGPFLTALAIAGNIRVASAIFGPSVKAPQPDALHAFAHSSGSATDMTAVMFRGTDVGVAAMAATEGLESGNAMPPAEVVRMIVHTVLRAAANATPADHALVDHRVGIQPVTNTSRGRVRYMFAALATAIANRAPMAELASRTRAAEWLMEVFTVGMADVGPGAVVPRALSEAAGVVAEFACAGVGHPPWTSLLQAAGIPPSDSATQVAFRSALMALACEAILSTGTDNDADGSWLGTEFLTASGRLSSARLPTMPTSALFMFSRALGHVGWWSCPNGHRYAVGECTMPMEKGKCPECGARVGGEFHVPVKGVERLGGVDDLFGNAGSEHLRGFSDGLQTGSLTTTHDLNAMRAALTDRSIALLRFELYGLLAMAAFSSSCIGAPTRAQRLVDASRDKIASRAALSWMELARTMDVGENDPVSALVLSTALVVMTGRGFVDLVGGRSSKPVGGAPGLDEIAAGDNGSAGAGVGLGTRLHVLVAGADARNRVEVLARAACSAFVSHSTARRRVADIRSALADQDATAFVASMVGRAPVSHMERLAGSTTDAWRFRVPLTKTTLRSALDAASPLDFALLRRVLADEERLPKIACLADVLPWVRLLQTTPGVRRLTREEASRVTNKEVVETMVAVESRSEARQTMERFCAAFNASFPLVTHLFECQANPFLTAGEGVEQRKVDLSGRRSASAREEMSETTPVCFSLPNVVRGDADAAGMCVVQLVRVLQNLNNALLEALVGEVRVRGAHGVHGALAVGAGAGAGAGAEAREEEEEAVVVTVDTPRETIESLLVSYDYHRDLAPLVVVASTSGDGVGLAGSRDIDLGMVDRALAWTLLGGKTQVQVALPQFEYPGEGSSSAQLAALKLVCAQSPLPSEVAAALRSDLDTVARRQPLEEVVDVAVAFAAEMVAVDPTTMLQAFVVDVLGMTLENVAPASVVQNVRLGHLAALHDFLEEARFGSPLDSVHPRFKAALPPDVASVVSAAASAGKLDMDVLLPALRDLLVSHLRGEGGGGLPADGDLAEYLGYATDVDLERLPWFAESFPSGLRLEHAFEVWRVWSGASASSSSSSSS